MSGHLGNCLSQIWLSKADSTWLIVISHRYDLCFMLLSQLALTISHDDAIACHWFIVIGCLVVWLTIVSYIMYDFRTWLIVMSHGFCACDPRRTHDLFYELWLVRYVAQLTHTSHLMDFTLWLTWVMSRMTRKYESQLREEPLYKGTIGTWVGVLHATI